MKDTFENARIHAKQDCPKCHGTGTYMYDHNHGTICNLCCTHNMGWFVLGEHHSDPGKLCCKAGCGTTKDKE